MNRTSLSNNNTRIEESDEMRVNSERGMNQMESDERSADHASWQNILPRGKI
jgi:hypothetical protein